MSLKKKMNDKRNSICGNVMLLSQSRDETSLFVFAKISVRLCKNFSSREKKKKFLFVSSRLVVTTTEGNVVRLDGKK